MTYPRPNRYCSILPSSFDPLTEHELTPLLLLPCFISLSAYRPTLTQTTGLKIAPLFDQSFLKHYYRKVVKDRSSFRVSLRDEELLCDQVLIFVKVCFAHVLSPYPTTRNIDVPYNTPSANVLLPVRS